MTVTVTGADEVVRALQQLGDTTELDAAGVASRTLLADTAREYAPSVSGSLQGSIGSVQSGTAHHIGSDSPYARWFHVPFLSDGGVRYAKMDRAGRTFGRIIPDNPFLARAATTKQEQVADTYLRAVQAWIVRAFAGVPRG